MKKCPYCAEKIQNEAIVCRYCGRDLPVENKPEGKKPDENFLSAMVNTILEDDDDNPPKEKSSENDSPKKETIKLKEGIGVFVAIVVLCIVAICYILFLKYIIPGTSTFFVKPTEYVYPTSIPPTMKPNDPELTSEPYNSSPSTSDTDTSWFTGGTLHKGKGLDWRNATYANRLATSADFIAATQDVDYGDMASFKEMAIDLEICISTATDGGYADNEDVTFIASFCIANMYPK